MLLKTRGIVLKTVKYGETSVIADIFTEEKGLHTFIGSGVRTARSKMPFNLFQPMMVLDMVTYFREDAGALNRLRELRAGHVFQQIPFDIRRGAVALFMAEVCQKSIHDGEENPDLFQFLLETLVFLDTTTQPIANIHLHFLLHLSGLLGFQPESESEEMQFFDLKEGAFLPAAPYHPSFLGPAETQQMLHLLQTPLENCHELSLDRLERKHLLRQFLQFFKFHIPGFSDLNTPEVLATVL